MKNVKLALLSSAVMFALLGCNESTPSNEKPTQEESKQAPSATSATEQLDTLLADYFEAGLKFNPIGLLNNSLLREFV